MSELSKLPNATIYLEATASDWKSVSFTARTLKYIGIRKVRGFMLNVTHFDWTVNNIRYGRKVSRRVGGKPFVVSTSYNGRGPVHYKARNGKRINVFCNVRYRGSGPKPTTNTGYAKVDGFLWLNRPGISGAGSCNGAPRDGEWWPRRGLMYAKYASAVAGARHQAPGSASSAAYRCAGWVRRGPTAGTTPHFPSAAAADWRRPAACAGNGPRLLTPRW